MIKNTQNVPKTVDNPWYNLFSFLYINFNHFSPKKGQKNTFQDLNFGLVDNKNAIETLF